MVRELWEIGSGDGQTMYVDGSLATYYDVTHGTYRDVETREGLYSTPPVRGGNIVASGRSGELWVPKVYGANSFLLNIWLAAAEGTGRDWLESRYDELVRIIGKKARPLLFRRTMANGSVRECYGEVVAPLQPEPIGQRALRIGMEVVVPEGVWRDSADMAELDSPLNTAVGQVDMAVVNATATAPSLFRFIAYGPFTSVQVYALRVGVPGEWWRYTGAALTGQTFQVDAWTWALATTGGLPIDNSLFSFSGRRYLTHDPEWGSNLLVVFTGQGATTKLAVAGRRSYYV